MKGIIVKVVLIINRKILNVTRFSDSNRFFFPYNFERIASLSGIDFEGIFTICPRETNFGIKHSFAISKKVLMISHDSFFADNKKDFII